MGTRTCSTSGMQLSMTEEEEEEEEKEEGEEEADDADDDDDDDDDGGGGSVVALELVGGTTCWYVRTMKGRYRSGSDRSQMIVARRWRIVDGFGDRDLVRK